MYSWQWPAQQLLTLIQFTGCYAGYLPLHVTTAVWVFGRAWMGGQSGQLAKTCFLLLKLIANKEKENNMTYGTYSKYYRITIYPDARYHVVSTYLSRRLPGKYGLFLNKPKPPPSKIRNYSPFVITVPSRLLPWNRCSQNRVVKSVCIVSKVGWQLGWLVGWLAGWLVGCWSFVEGFWAL
jgi:hypothetical protein